MDFPKKYTHQSIQQEVISQQKRNKLFGKKELKKAGEKWSISLVTWPILLSPNTIPNHQLLQTIKTDCIARYFRMLGKTVNYCPRFSYETGNQEETNKKNMIAERNRHIMKQKEKAIKQMIELGIWYNEKETISFLHPRTKRKLRNAIDCYMQEGLLQDDITINYRSTSRQTNIAHEDIIWKNCKGTVYNIRYFVDTKNITLIIPTTNPETIFWDVAIAVHPEDRRYKKLIWHKVIIPITNKTIPIIWEESIDTTKSNGIRRVSPCHDEWWLETAKKHKLPLNTFAIDHTWCFSELAGDFWGKKVVDFLGNILQNLEDIHNLESSHEEELMTPTEKISGEKLIPILSQQRFLNKPHEKKEWRYREINIYPSIYEDLWYKTAENQEMSKRPVSQKDSIWIPLPVRENKDENYFIWEYDILQASATKKKGEKILLALLIFNIIADRSINEHFNIEEFIDALLQKDENGQYVWEIYINALQEDLPRGYASELQELYKIFEYIKEEWTKNYEKCSIKLTELLSKTMGIVDKKWWKYVFDIANIVGSKKTLTASTEKCETTLATSILLLQQIENKGMVAEKTIFLWGEKEKTLGMRTLVLEKKEKAVQDIFIFPENKSCPEKKRDEILQQRWADNVRLQSMTQHVREANKLTDEEGEKHLQLLHKIRNAARYVRTNFIEAKRKKEVHYDLKELWAYLEKRGSKMEANEYRMLCRIKDLYSELTDAIEKNNIQQLSENIITCIKKDFGEKYLEIIKIRESELTPKIAIFCVGMFMQILHPIIPFLTEKIRNLFWFTGHIWNQKYTSFFDEKAKSYKTQLLMDIIDKFHYLRYHNGYPKHEKIHICFQCPLDILHYIKENEDIIKKLVQAEDIHYIESEKELQGYETENIINVIVGIRGVSKPLKKENTKDTRTKEKKIKEEELQRIRNLTAKLSLDKKKNKKNIEKNKEEMDKIKKEIEKIELEIKKNQMNEK